MFSTMFSRDKIVGNIYPILGLILIIGTLLLVVGFFIKGVNLQEINFAHLNMHPKKLYLIPIFFMTITCGLLSGFHSTQSAIIARTVKTEKEGRKVFYAMMCVESFIAMIWAAAAMHVYSLKLVPENIIGTANVINGIADVFVILRQLAMQFEELITYIKQRKEARANYSPQDIRRTEGQM